MSDTKERNLDDDQAQARLPHLMRIDEVAEHLGVSVRHVRRLVQERRIPFLKWGHFVMFDDAEIASWLEQFRYPPEVTGIEGSRGGARLGVGGLDWPGQSRPAGGRP